MQALILAGGFGTRLRPLTLSTPKPAVPLVNRPILSYQIELLKRAGITDVILSLNYQPDKIQEAMGDGSEYGVKITYVVEPKPLGTAGAVKFAEQFIKTTTVILNGDNLINLNIEAVAKDHRENGAIATLVLQRIENPVGYGLVELGEDGRIVSFLEKPTAEALRLIRTRTVNAGTYILEPEVLELIPKDENYSFEYGVFPKLLERGSRFRGYIDDSYWLDVGNPPRYLQAHQDIINHRVKGFSGKSEAAACEISEKAVICDVSVVGRGCVIHEGARIENSVIGENVVVGVGCTIRNSVIHARTRLEANVEVSDAIIANDCELRENSKATSGTVLGAKSILTEYSQV